MRKSILIVGLLALTTSVFAKEYALRDSVGVEKIAGKSYIIHLVEEKETIFAISRRYKTPVNEIIQSNEELKQGLKIGQRIKVPFVEKSDIPPGAKLHNVSPGETLFSIAQSYEVSVKDLMAWNDLQGNDLSSGQALIIEGVAITQADNTLSEPADSVLAEPKIEETPENKAKANTSEKPPAKAPTPPATAPTDTVYTSGGWITHRVEQGQTLFSIAKQYDAKVEDLITWNGLSSNNLSLGQSLKVGKDKEATIPTITSPPSSHRSEEEASVADNSPSNGPSVNTSPSSTSTAYKDIKEIGQAEVIDGTGNHKKYLVLHRSAPVGTIMRIRNEENDRTVFARVVGVLPDTGDNNKLIIKVSEAAFDQLRAVNSRFPVEVSY
ncbi:MAG: LysM peptidoglycan-binding domain-containing protein [Anditalea sp.]